MKIGIAINNDVKYMFEGAAHYEVSTMYEGFDIVFNASGEGLHVLAPQAVAEDVAKPTSSGILHETSTELLSIPLVDCSDTGLMELDTMRTQNRVFLQNTLPDEPAVVSVLTTAEYQTDTIPFNVMIVNAIRELVALEKAVAEKNAKINSMGSPVVQAKPGSTSFHITEQLKVVPYANTQSESTTAV